MDKFERYCDYVQILVFDGFLERVATLEYVAGSRFRAQLFPNLKTIKSKSEDLTDRLHMFVHEGVLSFESFICSDVF
jgi:hypothetical protein